MDYKASLEVLEKVLTELQEENTTVPILVEGEKDIAALRKLGMGGIILSVNAGMSLISFCDMIARQHTDIILLMDWDRRGGYICHTISKNLEGRVRCNLRYREIIAKHAMIRTVEGLPSWLETLYHKIAREEQKLQQP